MADEIKTNLAKIEKLIIDGQKETVEKVSKFVEEKINDAKAEIREDIRKGDNLLSKQLDSIHVSLKTEIVTTGKLLDYDIKEVGRKLDEHVRLPAHA